MATITEDHHHAGTVESLQQTSATSLSALASSTQSTSTTTLPPPLTSPPSNSSLTSLHPTNTVNHTPSSSSSSASPPLLEPEKSFLCSVHKSSSKQITQSKVILKVDDQGISIGDPKRGTQLAKYIFDDIVSWASSSGTFAFEISIGVSSGSSTPPKQTGKKEQNLRLLFLTKEGIAIAEAMNKAVAKIVAEEERRFELEEKRNREKKEKLEKERRKRGGE